MQSKSRQRSLNKQLISYVVVVKALLRPNHAEDCQIFYYTLAFILKVTLYEIVMVQISDIGQ